MKTHPNPVITRPGRNARWLLFSLLLCLAAGFCQPVKAQQGRNGYPAITKLCPGRGHRLMYAGRTAQIRDGQPRPEDRQLTLYLVPQGEPLTAGIVVGSVKEAVSYQVVYPPGHKNYSHPTMAEPPLGRLDFSIPANLPANLLNKPVQLRFGEPKPGMIYTGIAASYTIDPANCQ